MCYVVNFKDRGFVRGDCNNTAHYLEEVGHGDESRHDKSIACGAGGAHEWGAERQEGRDTRFPPTTAGEKSITDRPNGTQDHPSASWWGESPESTAQQQAVRRPMTTGSGRRAGSASFREVGSMGDSPSGDGSRGAAAGDEGSGAGLIWPVNHGVATAAAAGVHRSRKKQS